MRARARVETTRTRRERTQKEVEREARSKFWPIDPTFNRINKGRKRNFVDEYPIRLKMSGFLGNIFTLLPLALIRFIRAAKVTLFWKVETVRSIVLFLR